MSEFLSKAIEKIDQGMKEVKYEFIVKMETSNRLWDFEAESLVLNATENMKSFVSTCGGDLGLDDISLIEGRLYIDGEERCRVGCGVFGKTPCLSDRQLPPSERDEYKCGYYGMELTGVLQERDRLIEALRQVDVECRYCAYEGFDQVNCADNCNECRHQCHCFSCKMRNNWKWKGIEENTGGMG